VALLPASGQDTGSGLFALAVTALLLASARWPRHRHGARSAWRRCAGWARSWWTSRAGRGMNAAPGGGAVIEFPVTGQCWVLHPPGHSRWAFDLLPLQSGSGDVA
jgi:hypothetical protein